MSRRFAFVLTVLLSLTPLAWADSGYSVLYDVSVNTSTLAGLTGSLDFQFNPGPLVSQSASAEILNFRTNGAPVGSSSLTGDVSGGLPSTLTFANATPFNDYFQEFTFGASLSFNLLLSGPAVGAPNGTATSGSLFAFSMFSDAAGTVPALTTDPDGFAAIVAINLDGTTTATSYSSQTNVSAPQLVPEPASLALTAGAFLVLIFTMCFISCVNKRT